MVGTHGSEDYAKAVVQLLEDEHKLLSLDPQLLQQVLVCFPPNMQKSLAHMVSPVGTNHLRPLLQQPLNGGQPVASHGSVDGRKSASSSSSTPGSSSCGSRQPHSSSASSAAGGGTAVGETLVPTHWPSNTA